MTARRAALPLLACVLATSSTSCTSAREEPARAAPTDCPSRWVDPKKRFSFCTAPGARVSFTSSIDEHLGPIDYVYYATGPGTTFTVVATEKPFPFDRPPGARTDIDEQTPFAGRAARHLRVRFHEHSPASNAILEDHRHVYREAEDHDVVVERWTLAIAGGAIAVGARTDESTSASATAELSRSLSSFRFLDGS